MRAPESWLRKNALRTRSIGLGIDAGGRPFVAAFFVRFEQEGRQRRGGTYRQACVPRGEALCGTPLPVPSTVEVAEFGQTLSHATKVAEKAPHEVGSLRGIRNIVGQQAKLLSSQLYVSVRATAS